MGDSYTNEYFFDSGMIKQEPFSMEGIQISTTASVPIPTRRGMNSDMQDLGFEIDCLDSPPIDEGSVGSENTLLTDYQTVGSNLMWGTRLTTIDAESSQLDTFKMDDDDIFQVDKADLIQGPTLAELNANDDTLLADLNFDDLLLPEENKFSISLPANSVKFSMPSVHIINSNLSYLSNNNNNNTSSLITFTPSSCPQTGLGFYRDLIEPSSSVPSSPFDPFSPKSNAAFSPTSQHSSSSSLLATSSPPLQPTVVKAGSTQRHSTLHELLLKRDTHPPLNRTVPSTSTGGPSSPNGCKTLKTHSSRLSSSAPTRLGLEQIWQRREPRPHLVSTGSLAEAGSTSSLSTGGVLSPDPQDLSHDEGFDSDEDSEHYEDFSSDGDSDDENPRRLSTSSASKKERYFWQYNVQAKGPKGQRLVLKTKLEDPHILNEITDPVFSPSCSVRGIKHSGKARKGDGNDLTPNPRKLHSIGRELDKLGRIINDMTPVSELPFNVRPKTRKEKNKLASRACRLKKKAQHEANKLKLFGLEHEHKRLLTGISQTKQLLKMKLETSSENQEEISKQMDRVAKTATKVKIAGHSTEFVNKVLEKVKSGIPNGGLEEF